ncbi:MAG: DUF4386 family protein [Acidimicrobiia bacterium]
MTPARSSARWERYGWAAGIVYVAALVAETAISVTVPISQNDSAAKIANELNAHTTQLLIVVCLCVVYAAAFPIFLWKLYDLLHADNGRSRTLAVLVLVGGALFIAFHATSDVGIYAMLGAKVASYSAHHDPGISYTLYLTTFAIDSVGDVFGSLFLFAAGLLVIRSGLLPRWLAWVAIVAAIFLFLQGFGLGGVVAPFGLVFDGVGFVLLLVFVLVSSVIALRRVDAVPNASNPPVADPLL